MKLGWVGTWLPLLVPAFFANAYDVFLIRQYLLTIPRDLDEAAMIDGASALRILRSVILPQAWPVIVAVSIFTFVYSWNDFFGPLIYLAGHEELQPLQVALAAFNSIYYSEATLIQAGNIMTLIIPVILFVIFQRVFIRGHRHHRHREVAWRFGAGRPFLGRPVSGRADVRRRAPRPTDRPRGRAAPPRDARPARGPGLVLPAGPLGGGVPGSAPARWPRPGT